MGVCVYMYIYVCLLMSMKKKIEVWQSFCTCSFGNLAMKIGLLGYSSKRDKETHNKIE